MRTVRLLISFVVALVLSLGFLTPAWAQYTTGTPLVIGVDYPDQANQNPDAHRIFEYTDFFARAATVHTGDTVNFRAAPGSFHIVALAADETAARAAYPPFFPDPLDKTPATGTGGPKISLGPSLLSVTNGTL